MPNTLTPSVRTDPSETLVADVVAAFVRAKTLQTKLGGASPKSLAILSSTLNDLSKAMGPRRVADLCNDDLLEWICDHPEWESPHTMTHRQGIVVSAFRWAKDRRLVVDCPFRRTSKLFKALHPRTAIEPAEYVAVMALARRPGAHRVHQRSAKALRWALYFLWETGCRTCEMRVLAWEDVDLENGCATLDEHKTAQATGQPRVIPFTPELTRLLRWVHRRTRPAPQARLFLNGRGRPWTCPGFARLFRRYGKLAGIRVSISPYSLRHGFCVRALAARVGQRQIADVLGHSSTRYIEWYGRSARSNVRYLQGILGDINSAGR